MAEEVIGRGQLRLYGWRRALWLSGLVVVCFLFVFPIFWLFLTALRPESEVFYVHRGTHFTLSNLIRAFDAYQFKEAMFNSAVVATLGTFLSIVITLQSGYMLGRFRGKFRNAWFGLIYIVRTIPYITWGLPLYAMTQWLGIYDTYWGVLAPHLAVHVAFFSLVMKGFFENIPQSSEEAALIDGCSYWGVYFKIAVPQVLPGIFALSLICWLWTWNELLFAMLLTGSDTPMLTVTIVQFVNEIGMEWNLMAASAIIALIPAIAVTLFGQKYITKGLYM
jgi:multiple sugar transport system permease protein